MELERLHLVSAGHVQPDPRWRLPAHAHTFHEMIVVVGGAMEVGIAQRVVRARNGDVLFYHKQVPHAEWADPKAPVETFFASFEGDPASDLPVRVYDADGRVRVLVNWLYAERDAYAPNAAAMRDALLRAMVAEFVRLASGKRDALVEDIRAYVREHLAEPITLDQLAVRAGLSKYHFLRRYKTLTGRTPMDDVRAIRLEAARNAILTTNLPLKVIAPSVGLGDAYHLSRLFRRHLNLTPSELRTRISS